MLKPPYKETITPRFGRSGPNHADAARDRDYPFSKSPAPKHRSSSAEFHNILQDCPTPLRATAG